MLIKKFKTIDSTNTYALEHFEELEDFSVISADSQTKGRGRFERRWESQDFENIYISIVLKPQKKDYLPNLTQYLSVVTAQVIESYGIKSQIKWPNDVLIDGKKICGILCESYIKNNQIQGVVLGIGVNLNMPQEIINKIDRPAASLNLLKGEKIDKNFFLKRLLQEFENGYKTLIHQGFSSIRESYLKRINFLGKTIHIQKRDNEKIEKYTAINIDSKGKLVVIDENNIEKTILSGDLIL